MPTEKPIVNQAPRKKIVDPTNVKELQFLIKKQVSRMEGGSGEPFAIPEITDSTDQAQLQAAFESDFFYFNYQLWWLGDYDDGAHYYYSCNGSSIDTIALNVDGVDEYYMEGPEETSIGKVELTYELTSDPGQADIEAAFNSGAMFIKQNDIIYTKIYSDESYHGYASTEVDDGGLYGFYYLGLSDLGEQEDPSVDRYECITDEILKQPSTSLYKHEIAINDGSIEFHFVSTNNTAYQATDEFSIDNTVSIIKFVDNDGDPDYYIISSFDLSNGTLSVVGFKNGVYGTYTFIVTNLVDSVAFI